MVNDGFGFTAVLYTKPGGKGFCELGFSLHNDCRSLTTDYTDWHRLFLIPGLVANKVQKYIICFWMQRNLLKRERLEHGLDGFRWLSERIFTDEELNTDPGRIW